MLSKVWKIILICKYFRIISTEAKYFSRTCSTPPPGLESDSGEFAHPNSFIKAQRSPKAKKIRLDVSHVSVASVSDNNKLVALAGSTSK